MFGIFDFDVCCLDFSSDVEGTAFLNNAPVTTDLEGIVFCV
jgi:hypothetical protein